MSDNELLDHSGSSKEPNDPRVVTIIIPLLSLVFVGAIFKLMHWPGYSLFILVPTGALLAYMVVQVIFGRKSTLNLILLLANLLLLTYFLWGVFFNDGHPFNEKGLLIYGGVFVIVLLALLFNQWLKRRG